MTTDAPSGKDEVRGHRFDDEVVLGRIGEAKDRLDEVLLEGGDVDADASGIRRIDTAGMQLIVAFCREVRRRGRVVTLRGPSAAFSEAACRLGVLPWLPIAGEGAARG
jgi:ABC-type transporter Mla MlaB component